MPFVDHLVDLHGLCEYPFGVDDALGDHLALDKMGSVVETGDELRVELVHNFLVEEIFYCFFAKIINC